MKPTELQDLLDREGVPMEARAPIRLRDNGRELGATWTNSHGCGEVDQDLAELAHVGAIVKWLTMNHCEVRVKDSDTGASLMLRRAFLNDIVVYRDSLTEALAHACGRIAKEKDNA